MTNVSPFTQKSLKTHSGRSLVVVTITTANTRIKVLISQTICQKKPNPKSGYAREYSSKNIIKEAVNKQRSKDTLTDTKTS